MARLKLTYFDFHGGRGEPARLALAIGGIAFEDDRVAFAGRPSPEPNARQFDASPAPPAPRVRGPGLP